MDVKALGENPVSPVEKRGQTESKVSHSSSDGARPVALGSGDGASKVEPVHRKPRIKVFVDEATKRPGFVVVDDETGEIIREVPPEEVLKLAAKMKQMAGFLLDEVV
jgi:flagellar protein FlaG